MKSASKMCEYSTPKVDEVLVIGVKQHFNNIWCVKNGQMKDSKYHHFED